ncbi:replication restart helicase PriA [Dehalogenimonas etheniformans]|uniref:Replication restart protein PriA n=1 Tax=Dehalogenimonas etheniformans TaxID=1536648 RepID=A0A2P5P6R9_9CHLR|nr:primosomal protein N' [Dehalogenimonas etheniformans]PPD58001.1 primosomal protein N' [Dehalogenimonas etheniformans]QNT75350.1 primosomal protein N' [Dehalogenimonas etheniformans]
MPYAEVSVNSPAAGRSAYSYELPAGLTVRPGQAVLVPFGPRVLQGIVVEVSETPRFDDTRQLSGIIDPPLCLTPQQLTVGMWISRHYLAPLFPSLALWLPPGFERSAESVFTRSGLDIGEIPLSDLESNFLATLDTRVPTDQKTLEKRFGKVAAQKAIRHLLGHGLIERRYRLQAIKVKPRLEKIAHLRIDTEKAQQAAAGLLKRSPKQSAVLRFLANSRGRLSVTEIRREFGEVNAILSALVNKKLIEISMEESRRNPRLPAAVELPMAHTLTPAQSAAVSVVTAGIDEAKGEAFLLHGVTGSGKTEVYLHAANYALKQGKQVVVLVPEISLTHQIIERFTARFPGRVAVLHSKLSLGERFDQWRGIAEGDYDIVIGPRSALFAPFTNPGLIVIDEEHEWAYKQQDTPPLYHAREVARRLALETGAALLLGSATPDIETYNKAERGEYRLLELPDRLTPHPSAPLPPVTLIDMRDELKSGNLSIFSRKLKAEMESALKNGEQVILFFNRRGGATFIQCRDCGEVLKCRHCRLPLGFHPVENRLVCHHCNAQYRVPTVCPVCKGSRIKFIGLGTQKLEEETKKEFSGARVLRWDSDAARGKDSGYQIFDDFRAGKADILIGTQVVARGLDLPRVGLVGVINADTALNLPDFRAGERTFQLLLQVAGRAGRGEFPGRVVVQSYQPSHYAIAAAVAHDFKTFYQKELEYRKILGYPPFNKLAVLTVQHLNEADGLQLAHDLKKTLELERDSTGVSGIEFIGPAPAFIPRRRGKYRWQVIVKGRNIVEFLSKTNLSSSIGVDIDPLGLD